MDISTLNAVIKTLKSQRDDYGRMLDWAVMSDEPENNEFGNMWATKHVTVKQTIELVQKMLDEELVYRDLDLTREAV